MDHTQPAGPNAHLTLTRRRAFQGLGGGLAASLLYAGGVRPQSLLPDTDDNHSASHLHTATPPSNQEPQTREFTLTAEEFDWEIMPGVTTRAWGYNGQTPGPEIRVPEGDLVRVTLRNKLSVPTTVHWHGIHSRPEMDGPAGLNQAAVQPGEEFVYEFIATPAGTRWYHSHADPALQVPMGLYGPLIVEPKASIRPSTYDREYTLMLGEWDSELTPDVAAGRAPRGAKDQLLRGGELGADMFLVNGKAHGAIPPLVVKEGERVLIRLINAGHMAHPVHGHGHTFKLVATDGNPIPLGMEWLKDTVLVGPAERYDLEFVADNPGVWMFHCHIEHHMANGMMTVIQYEGHKPTGPAADVLDDTMTHGDHGTHATPASTDETGTTPTEAAVITEGEVQVIMVDDRFQPEWLEVPAGTTVTWLNKGADWHNVASSKAGFASDRMPNGSTYSFTFDTPGEYKIVCRHHALAGMTGTIVVV